MLRVDPIRIESGVRFGDPKPNPTNERTNELTKQFTYASQSGCLPKRTGAYGTSCWSRLICGGDEERQEDDRLANEVFAVVHDIASECLPDERTAR